MATTILNYNKRTMLLLLATTLVLVGFVMFVNADRVGAQVQQCGTGEYYNQGNGGIGCAGDTVICGPGFSKGRINPNDGEGGTQDQPLNCLEDDEDLSGDDDEEESLSIPVATTDLQQGLFAGAGVEGAGTCTIRTGLSLDEWNSLGLTAPKDTNKPSADQYQVACTYSLVKQIISWITLLIGVAALAFILLAGFLWIVAKEDTEKTKKARNTLIAAIAGFAVVALAQVILRIVQAVI